VARSSWLLTSDFALFPPLPFVFLEKLVTFKPLKTKNKTAYATTFKQQTQQQKPQPSGGYQTPE
jgi:hypothetical protein